MNASLPSLSVIVVSYNSAATLEATLEAALAQDYPGLELIVWDNASADESLAIARRFEPRGVHVVASPVNRGFAGGNNDAVSQSRGEFIFLLNPDAVLIDPDGLRQMAAAFAERADLGILGAKLLDSDRRTILHMGGRIDPAAHCSLFAMGQPDDGQWDSPMEVDFVIGAALALRRSTWERLGGFDEDFGPAYYEDTDLCVRCRKLGLKVLAWPAVRLVHPDDHKSLAPRSPAFWWYHHRHRLWFNVKNAPAGRLLTSVLPAEFRWFASPCSVGLRRFMLKIYYYTLRRWIARRILHQQPKPFRGQ